MSTATRKEDRGNSRPVLVAGGGGMLARALRPLAPAAHFLGRAELDVRSAEACDAVLDRLRPRLVYNLAAYTKVDAAEADEAEALRVNGHGPGHLARACKRVGARLVHVSTDYVFDGRTQAAAALPDHPDGGGAPSPQPPASAGAAGRPRLRPWREDDPTGPLSAYGRTKLEGERAVEREMEDAVIVRTAWLYGDGGPNFVDTMLRLAGEKQELRVVDDQVGGPTWTHELAEALVLLGEGGFRGLCHFACSGQVSWHGFAAHILRRAGWTGRLEAIPSTELERPAPRPAYSVLDTGRYTRWTGRTPRPWQEAADTFLDLRLNATRPVA